MQKYITPRLNLPQVISQREGGHANVVTFLAPDLATYISGVYLPVGGKNEMPGI
jgi:hypothetical protein